MKKIFLFFVLCIVFISCAQKKGITTPIDEGDDGGETVSTATFTATNTPYVFPTIAYTATATNTPYIFSTNTPTDTPTDTSTDTSTDTHTPIPTSTPTETPTETPAITDDWWQVSTTMPVNYTLEGFERKQDAPCRPDQTSLNFYVEEYHNYTTSIQSLYARIKFDPGFIFAKDTGLKITYHFNKDLDGYKFDAIFRIENSNGDLLSVALQDTNDGCIVQSIPYDKTYTITQMYLDVRVYQDGFLSTTDIYIAEITDY